MVIEVNFVPLGVKINEERNEGKRVKTMPP